MSLFSFRRQNVISGYKNIASLIFVVVFIEPCILSSPINNGFSIKFNPIAVKEDKVSKTSSALFAKIPQDLPTKVARTVLSENIFPRAVDLAAGCTNQIARVMFPIQDNFNELNESNIRNQVDYINVPIIKQNASDYKILIVSAPQNVKLGQGDAKKMLVYIVFPVDDIGDSVNIPSIYFVNKSDGKLDLKSQERVDPIFIIDNNRTVTGLKSKEVSKYIKFKSKFTNRLNFDINNLTLT